ncbi:hypothetical protein TanjilG_28424 [Lupinus angustifolius]|uniref:Uncharacterized protein n=1 Tax=Lupinus angustifolius TaxID=3871 RepID=A0A1J7G864_LUPAN|nr:PREDICTED: uncharacterized protein LOC109327828 [Lupinus angustifolius]OIV96567.1 hypothetical protein TanjilG_28424 [Lupinus angustifolius]
MANLRRPYSSKDKDKVGWFNPNGRCKKHLKHHQSPGICSLCLKDKLSQLSSSSSSSKKTISGACDSSSPSSSLSSYYSSSSASSLASPMHPFKERKSGSSSISIFLTSSSSKHGLVKSRSMAFLPRRRKDGEEDNTKNIVKKEGFWFKLLYPKNKRSMENKDIKRVHSKSLREAMTLAS